MIAGLAVAAAGLDRKLGGVAAAYVLILANRGAHPHPVRRPPHSRLIHFAVLAGSVDAVA